MEKKEKKQQQQQSSKKGSNKPQSEKGQQQQQKRSAKAAPKVDQSEDVKREQKLQAILLADSFTSNFRPVSAEGPKVLLPLVNVPMLEYTLEFLSQNGVEEVFIFCVRHAEKIQNYVNQSKWPSILSVRCIQSTSCISPGDALRELDTMNIIRSDPFVLISGDVIANINLKEAIAFHKRKRKEDINNVMTVVLKEVQKTAGAKPVLDDLVVAMNRVSSQIVLFENAYKKDNVKVSLELMAEHPKGLTFYTDLLDCNVDICSPELMVQFSDNFDYQDIRRDFIRNEVGNWSLGKHIYGYRIQNEYAARVQDFRSYHSICRDIVTRWVYPLVPDAQLLPGSNYVHTKRYTYRESGVKVSRSAVLGEAVVLSRGAVVGDNAHLRRTIVGRDCLIGSNTRITDSHIWQGAVIENNVTIDRAVVCDGVVIGAGAVIPRGCVLSYGVKIGAGAVLPEFTRVARRGAEDEEGFGQETCDPCGALGEGSTGYVWQPSAEQKLGDPDEDSDEEEALDFERELRGEAVDAIRAGSIGCWEQEQWKSALWSRMPAPEEEESDNEGYDEDDVDADGNGASGAYGGGNNGGNGGGGSQFTGDADAAAARDVLNFGKVVGDMVTTGHAEGHPASSLLMEIKGYKFAQNKTFSDCLGGIVPALLILVLKQCTDPTTGTVKQTAFLAKLKDTLKADGWGYTLLDAMIQDTKEEVEVITALENVALCPQYSPALYAIFRYMLQVLYDGEIISEDAVLRWIAKREALEQEVLEDAAQGESPSAAVVMGDSTIEIWERDRVKLFREPAVQAFVEWVQAEDESSEDGEESGSEEEESDEEED